MSAPFRGDLRMVSMARYIDDHIAMLDDLARTGPPAAAIARPLADALRACRAQGKGNLATLIIMSLVMDLGGVAEEAIDLWCPLSALVGAPVAMERSGP